MNHLKSLINIMIFKNFNFYFLILKFLYNFAATNKKTNYEMSTSNFEYLSRKNGIFRSIRGEGYTVEKEILKVEKIEKA